MTSECGFGTISRVHVQKQARAVLRALAGGINDEVDTSCLLWRDVPAHPCQVCLCGGPGSRSPVAFIWSGLLTLEHHHAAVSRSAEKARSESDRPLRSLASGGTVWREPGQGGRSIHRLSERASA